MYMKQFLDDPLGLLILLDAKGSLDAQTAASLRNLPSYIQEVEKFISHVPAQNGTGHLTNGHGHTDIEIFLQSLESDEELYRLLNTTREKIQLLEVKKALATVIYNLLQKSWEAGRANFNVIQREVFEAKSLKRSLEKCRTLL